MMGAWHRRRYFFIGFIVFSLIASFLSPLQSLAVIPGEGGDGTVSPYTYAGMNPDQRAQSYALYYGIVGCVTDIKEISNDDVISGGFDGAVNSYLYSFYIDASDGKSECQTAEKKAVALWGYKSLDEALKAWGYQPPTGSSNDWTSSYPGRDTAAAIIKKVYGGAQPTLGPEAEYLYWYRTATAACKLASPQPYAAASTSIKHAADDPTGTKYLKLIDMSTDYKSTIPNIYSIGDWSNLIRAMPANSPQGVERISCKDAADRANQKALAYQLWAAQNVDTANSLIPETSTEGPDQNTCTIDGVGWLVCPVITFLGTLNDAAFGFLNNWLEIPARIFTDPATKGVWETFRNLANITFVMAFLIIIYSQLTGAGISNYGIKKLLPKLILTAILVNASFIICSLLVDLSNIVGGSLYQILTSVDVGGNATEPGKLSSIWTTTLSAVLTGGAIVAILALIIFAPMSLLAFALVIMILVARQAFAILLVVISPLAFVAYLLPNTEHLFKKWWKAFSAILMVYVIIGALFGASTLASKILLSVSQSDNADSATLKIVSAAIMAVPLFAVPALLKGAMSAAGGIGNSIAKLQDRANGRAGKSVKEGRIGEAMGAHNARRQSAKINRRVGNGRYLGVVPSARINKAIDNSKFGHLIGADRGRAAATAAYNKEQFEATEREMSTMGEANANQLLAIGMDKTQSAERRAAAFRKLETVGGYQHIQKAYDYLLKEGAQTGSARDKDIGDVQQLAASALIKKKPAGVKTSTANALGTGTAASADGYYGALRYRVEAGEFDTGDYAGMDKDELIRLAELSQKKELSATAIDDIRKAVDAIGKDETLKKTMNPERLQLFSDILDGTGPKDRDKVARNIDKKTGAVMAGKSTGGLESID